MATFETAQIFDESDTDSCLPFFPPVFEYKAVTFQKMSVVMQMSYIDTGKHTMPNSQSFVREYNSVICKL